MEMMATIKKFLAAIIFPDQIKTAKNLQKAHKLQRSGSCIFNNIGFKNRKGFNFSRCQDHTVMCTHIWRFFKKHGNIEIYVYTTAKRCS